MLTTLPVSLLTLQLAPLLSPPPPPPPLLLLLLLLSWSLCGDQPSGWPICCSQLLARLCAPAAGAAEMPSPPPPPPSPTTAFSISSHVVPTSNRRRSAHAREKLASAAYVGRARPAADDPGALGLT
jgi:hypothetical protein